MEPTKRLVQFFRPDPAVEVNDELRFHLDALIAENIASGMNPDDARAAAVRRFGDVGGVTRTLTSISAHRARRMRLTERFGTLRQDLRIAIRQLARTPVLTCAAIVTMALGIGANSAIFSVIYSVLVRPLPFKDADRLLVLRERNGANDMQGMFVTVGNYTTWTEQAREFEAIGAYYFGGFTLTGAGDPQRLTGVLATASYWKALAIPPALGRYFNDDEDRPGGDKVVVLSHATWQSSFGGDSTVIGRKILLNAEPYTVIGVASPDYALTQRSGNIWLPIALTPQSKAEHRDHELTVVGLVRRGVAPAQAVAELTRIETQLAREYPHGYFDGAILAHSERDAIIGPFQKLLWMIGGAVGLVLLIACVNVANLLLGRAASRRREMAVRAALGAGRTRLVTQLLTESLALAFAGAAAGLALAQLGIVTIVRVAPPLVPRLRDASLNAPVLAFSVVLAVACGIAFGLVPALRMSRIDVQQSLRDGARGLIAGGRDFLRGALVVVEVAVSLVLLVGAGLCVRSAVLLERVDLGFDPHNLLVASIALPGAQYRSDTAVAVAYQRVLERARGIAGVQSATLISRMPVASGGSDCGIAAQGAPDGQTSGGNLRIIAPNYFETMRTPVVHGRAFAETDDVHAPPVVILTAGLAQQLFGTADAVGKRVTGCVGGAAGGREVVGVVGDVHARGLRDGAVAEIYLPQAQVPQRSMWIAVRGRVPAAGLAPALHAAVASVDPSLPLASLSTMDDVLARSLAPQKFITTLLVLLAIVGAALSAVGMYSVISYLVAQRTHEIGIRMALGAQATQVAGLVVGQGVALALGGVAVGAALSLVAMRIVNGMLFGVTGHDPVTFAGVAALVLGVAVVASVVPAWRATRVDPLVALRSS